MSPYGNGKRIKSYLIKVPRLLLNWKWKQL